MSTTSTTEESTTEVVERVARRLMIPVHDLTSVDGGRGEHRERVQSVADESGSRCEIAAFLDGVPGRYVASEWNLEPTAFGGAQLRRFGRGSTADAAARAMLGQTVLGQSRSLEGGLLSRLLRRGR